MDTQEHGVVAVTEEGGERASTGQTGQVVGSLKVLLLIPFIFSGQ